MQVVCYALPTLNEVQNVTTSGNVSSALYSNQYDMLFLRDSASGVRVLNASTGAQLSMRTPTPTGSFTDFAFSPSGQYLYVADYGGTIVGYGTPAHPSFVHRYDLQSGTWTSAQAIGIGYRIAPVDDNRVFLVGQDQTVDISLQSYAPDSLMTQLAQSSGYQGDIEYSASLGRLIYNTSGLSQTDVRAYTLSGNTLTGAESVNGSPYGSSGVLSTDGLTYYYNQAALNAANLTQNIVTFSQSIGAATPTVAFGTTNYFNAATGASLGSIPFTPQSWTIGANNRDVWAVEQPSGGSTTLHHYIIAQSSIWNTAGSGSWADTAKWNPSGLPDGIDNTADLSQVTLASDATVALDGDRTVGRVVLGDVGATRNWTVSPGSGGVLTLQVTGGTPSISVINQTATMNVAIAGAQGMKKEGAGTLVLAVDSIYTGGTTINGGTLQVASESNLGGGEMTINAGTLRAAGSIDSARAITLGSTASTIQVDSGFTYSASAGAIVSGTGGLTKTGGGTLDLTAIAAAYTGATTVNAGMLKLGSFSSAAQVTVASGATMDVSGSNLVLGAVANSGDIAFSGNAGTITLSALSGPGVTTFSAGANLPTFSNGTINVAGSATITSATGGTANLNGATATIGTLSNTSVNLASGTALSVSAGTQTSGSINGAGVLTKTGTGTLILGSLNTYTGGTAISAGTLQIGNGGTTGSIVGNVLNSGTLVFNRSDSIVYGGQISGTGAVRKSGAGALTLTGSNNYTGGTTISTGTLQLGDGTEVGTVAGGVINNGTLAFNTPADGQTFSGVITGTGSVAKLGPGTQVLTSSNSYSGGTTVSAGRLQVGNGGTVGSITGNVTNNATLVFNRSDSVGLPGTISGTGRVEQTGAGTLTLSANVTNAVLVTKGRVVVGPTSTLIGDVTTSGAGRFESGGGTINVANLDNSGIFSGSADVYGSFVNRPTGDVRLGAGQSMTLQISTPQSNAGAVEVLGNAIYQATFESVGAFTNSQGGNSLIVARNASLRFNGGLSNHGAVSMIYGLTDVFGDVSNELDGSLAVVGGAGVTFYDDVIQNGTMSLSSAGSTQSSAVFLGSLSGAGSFTGGGDVYVLGDLRPGNSSAIVTMTNNVSLAAGSRTHIELGGITAGSGYDRLIVNGGLQLGGALEVSLTGGFNPSVGQSFDILDWTGLNGTFSSISLPELATGKTWDTTLLYSAGVISVSAAILPGDFDHDGDCDADDLVFWQGAFGQGSGADVNSDGESDGADFLAWQLQFSNAWAPLGAAQVPESATLALGLIGCLGLLTNHPGRSRLT
ncbi:beta strand repeat-containing protein [Lacipirellula limnantheis]|uniref:Autotransporter-associated beta strand repeat protein n=1 Tax=Lacipirellula limnantheis TaxID=2528024 RepID=A0A517TTJ2_9BACT|nr:autotransporter-associated beta strand repeat-containing protein [Lacipirellula limnantheis]QDT71698.1 Autotransporter-associated beta strand repeat protein [Lacipirellula limnantheis]